MTSSLARLTGKSRPCSRNHSRACRAMPSSATLLKTSAMASWMRRSGSFSILSPTFKKPTGTVTTSSPRRWSIVMGRLPLQATRPKHAGRQVRHGQTACCAKSYSETDRTSKLVLPEICQRKPRKGCNGKQHRPARAPHESGRAAHTRDATDIEARKLQSRGCFVVSLYNEFRSHSAIGNKVPISLMNGSSARPPS